MFTITIQCKDLNEFSSISAMLSGNKPVQAFATQVVKTEPEKTEAAAPKKTKAKKEKAPDTSHSDGIAKQMAEEVEETKEVPSISVSKEDVAAALQKVNTAKGLATARKILADFECQRLSDVAPEAYVDFVLACDQACV